MALRYFLTQSKEIDFSSLQLDSPCHDLAKRTFRNGEFYERFSSDLAPAGLAFFQSDYDPSLKEFYHHTLKMKEPRYEYHFVQPFIRDWSSMNTKLRK